MKSRFALIKKYLEEPYPYYYKDQKKLIIVLLLISILSFCFSYFFDPFVVNVSEHKIDYHWILLIHAFIPFPIAYVFFSVINSSIKTDQIWTLGKEIFTLSIILFLIGIVDFLIRDFIYTNPDNWSFRYFWEEIRNTFLVGFLLLLIVLPLNLERLINKHITNIKKLPTNSVQEQIQAIISIKTSVPNEVLELEIGNFVFAKVESNYTEIFTFSNDKLSKTLIRITLKELEEQLKSFSHIFKTHRSFLVNLNAIDSISGNAQGYQLALKNSSFIIPVSRSKIALFNTIFSKV